MKKVFFVSVILSCFLLSFFGCSKESPTQPEYNNIYGTWNLVKKTGGFAGGDSYPETGKVVTIKITRGNNYSEFINGEKQFESRFEIKKETTSTTNQNSNFICLTDVKAFPNKLAIIQVSSDKLQLSDDCFDGYVFTYELLSKER